MINSTRLAVILREEASRVFNEAEAHEDDLIHQAYHGGGSVRSSTDSERTPVDRDIDIDPGGDPSEDDVDSPDEESRPSDAEEVESGLLSKFRDSKIVDFGLDLLGTVGGWAAAGATAGSMGLGAPPAYVLAAVPDLLNSIRHAARGDKINAAIYFLCALPVIGEVLGPARLSIRFLGTAARTMEVYELIKKVRSLVSGLRTLPAAKKSIGNIKDLVKDYFPDFDADSVERDAMVILEGSDEEVEELVSRSGHETPADRPASAKPKTPERPDYEVSTEADPLAESLRRRRVSIIFESPKPSGSKSSKSSKPSSKKQEPLPPIPTTLEFEREMKDIIAAHYAGEDIESWLTHDILGSKMSSRGLSRKTGWSGDDDFYRKPSASYMAQHLATHRDPEIRGIGQRVLRKMGERMGRHRFSRMGSGFGLDPVEDEN